ncbi:hypothetical protein GOARA_067_00320 [Gordonia araii NBRC 100433]|uniref:Uncharacterized protein n=1 Tax=Gordonia araii NBRC 100433 TaxID=1073574 RepID=G7H651_9ACTN|nr:hypothetical protein [Gordonia araii]NNG98713.1 hypothetical protein [Gordonia araii NBRC 100433]GAB11290.1 hypothetical protein GOARA_067_00320 [Gordonia araii NBRC 100433]
MRRTRIALGALTVALLVTVAACSSDENASAPSSAPSAANAGSPRVAMHECQEIPGDGRIYRSGSRLTFSRGSMLVAIPKDRSAKPKPTPSSPPPAGPVAPPAPPPNVLPPPAPAPQYPPAPQVPPAPQYPPAPQAPPAPQYPPLAPQYPNYPPAHHSPRHGGAVVPVTKGPEAPSSDTDECVSLTRWGPASPEVPPDGLLFTFRGTGTEGGQISFPAVALTGGVLPPIGQEKPRVGPLVETIPADIGVSLGGKYYLATGCPLKIVAMSPTRAAGHFACPSAIPMRENPLAPNDANRNPDDEAEDPPPPPQRPGPPAPGQPAPPAPGQPAPPAPGQPAPPAPGRPAPPAPANPDATHISGWFEVKP